MNTPEKCVVAQQSQGFSRGVTHLEARLEPSCVSTAVLCSVVQVGSRELHKAVVIMTNHGSEATQREE